MQEYSKKKTDRTFASQLPKNLIANIMYFIINVAIGIMLTPFFISKLGIAAYGIIPLATAITGYVGIFVGALNTSISRFLAVDLQREDYITANRTFNTAIFGLSAIFIIMVPIIVTISFFVPQIFNIPAGQESGAVILFLGVFIAFMIRSWSGNFTVQLFAYNRLDYQNIVNATNLVVSVGLIAIFLNLYDPNLALVGIAYLIGSIFASAISIILAKRVCPHLKLSIYSVDISRFKDLCGMSLWVIIDDIGTLLLLQIELIIVNKLFGASSAGEYAIALQWAVLLRSIGGTISGVVTPIVFAYYAREQIETLTKMIVSAVKLMGLFIAFPIGCLCGFAPQILTIWVGDEFIFLAPLIMLMTLPLTINISVNPLFSINVAYNKIRTPAIITLIAGAVNILLAISLPFIFGIGYYGVAAAGIISLTLKNITFTPWYANKIVGIRLQTFFKSVLPGVIIAIALIIVSKGVNFLIPITSLPVLVLVACPIGLLYIIIVWIFCLSSFERGIFLSYIPQKFKNYQYLIGKIHKQ